MKWKTKKNVFELNLTRGLYVTSRRGKKKNQFSLTWDYAISFKRPRWGGTFFNLSAQGHQGSISFLDDETTGSVEVVLLGLRLLAFWIIRKRGST